MPEITHEQIIKDLKSNADLLTSQQQALAKEIDFLHSAKKEIALGAALEYSANGVHIVDPKILVEVAETIYQWLIKTDEKP